MRCTSTSTTLAALTLLLTSLASASSSILGIDYGNEFIKAALVKPGIPIEIVLTKDSKRKEIAAVAFKPKSSTSPAGMSPERLYGGDAVNFAARYPDDVYPNLKQLLGSYEIRDPQVQDYAQKFPSLRMALSPAPSRSTVEFKSPASPDGSFSIEELIAMQLVSVRKSGEALAADGNTITDCVITIPAYFTAEERHAIIAASEMAGMKVMSLVSDGVAVGLNYAMTRQYTVDTTPEVHIIYDMGAGSTTATVVQVRGKSIKEGRTNKTVTEVSAIGVGFDRSLGGDVFNQKMFDLLLNEFAESKAGKKLAEMEGKPIKDLLTGRQRAKLWREAARIRHILSANTEAVSSIESFFPDIDFRSRKIQRAEFEDLLKEYTVRITKPIIDSVYKLKRGLEEIDSIIIFGGGARAPFVQKVLADLVGDKISKNVNADEAAVLGATFRGASLSKLFRVKDIRVQDVSSYNVGMTYTSEATGKEISQLLFAAPAWRGHNQFVPLKMTNDFSFNIYQVLGHPLDPASPRENIFKVATTNLTASLAKLKTDVNCLENTIVANLNVKLEEKYGLPEVISVDVSCEYEKKAGLVDDVKGFFGFGSKDKDQKVLKDETAEESSKSASGSSSSKTTKTKSKTKSADPIPTGESGKPIEKIEVSFTVERSGLAPLTTEELEASKLKLRVFEDDDTTRTLREEARNSLEAFTYKGMELLSSDSFIAVATEEQLEALRNKINEVSEWIYTREADLASRDVLLGKLKELRDLELPISKRRKETELRPDGITRLNVNLKDGKKLIEKMKVAVAKHESAMTSWSSYSSSFVESVSSASSSSSSASSVSAAAAAASAEAAASSSSLEDSATKGSASPSSSVDPLDDLDSSKSSTSTSSKSTKTKSTRTTTKKPTSAPTVLYTLDDIKDLEAVVEETDKWFKEKQKEQNALKAHEDPVLLSKDLQTRSQQIESNIRALSNRKSSNYTPPKPKKKRSGKAAKEVKKKLNLKDVEGVEGFEDSVERMIENMSDEELEKLLEQLKQEGAKEAPEAEAVPEGESEESSTSTAAESKATKHDEL